MWTIILLPFALHAALDACVQCPMAIEIYIHDNAMLHLCVYCVLRVTLAYLLAGALELHGSAVAGVLSMACVGFNLVTVCDVQLRPLGCLFLRLRCTPMHVPHHVAVRAGLLPLSKGSRTTCTWCMCSAQFSCPTKLAI